MRVTTTLALMGLSVLAPAAIHRASANPEECRDAIDSYRSAKSDISDALRRYARCISSSDGRDDCSSEFSALRSAQDDFETAVSDYGSECS
jgi:hypothetical protein